MTPEFKAALGLSVGLHAAALAGFSSAVSPAKFDVERAPTSLEIVVVAQPKAAPARMPEDPAPAQIEPEPAEPIDEPPDAVEDAVVIPPQTGALAEMLPSYLRNPAPVYPRLARERGEQGTVLLEAEVLESGRCGRLHVLASSGSRLLDEAAASAIARWQFEPAKRGQQPVAVSVQIPVTFRLVDDLDE